MLTLFTKKFQEEKKKNPAFLSTNPEMFKKATREIGVFAKKIEFLVSKGFKQEWGCPNENFFKHKIALRRNDAVFSKRLGRIEEVYEAIVGRVMNDPNSVDADKINEYFVIRPEPI